jgi:hypothetical protein
MSTKEGTYVDWAAAVAAAISNRKLGVATVVIADARIIDCARRHHNDRPLTEYRAVTTRVGAGPRLDEQRILANLRWTDARRWAGW